MVFKDINGYKHQLFVCGNLTCSTIPVGKCAFIYTNTTTHRGIEPLLPVRQTGIMTFIRMGLHLLKINRYIRRPSFLMEDGFSNNYLFLTTTHRGIEPLSPVRQTGIITFIRMGLNYPVSSNPDYDNTLLGEYFQHELSPVIAAGGIRTHDL